jgi:hypothetical protein
MRYLVENGFNAAAAQMQLQVRRCSK